VEAKLRQEIETRLGEAGWRVEGLSVNVAPDLNRGECRLGKIWKNNLTQEPPPRAAIHLEPQGSGLWLVRGEGEFVSLRFSVDVSAEMARQVDQDSQRKFVRLVVETSAMTFEGQPTDWDKVESLLANVADRKKAVLEFAVTSDQITVAQQNEWFQKATAFAREHGFEYASFIGIHPLGSKGTIAAPTVPPIQTNAAVQGPAIERVLYSIAAQRPIRLLDLDSGEQIELPADREKGTEEQFFFWLAERGVDWMAQGHRNAWTLTTSLKLVSLGEDLWSAASPAALREALTTGTNALSREDTVFGYDQYRLDTTTALPLTFAFETRQDGLGALQITGFTENPPGVKIRYKLAR
jgi:hypothetical protein